MNSTKFLIFDFRSTVKLLPKETEEIEKIFLSFDRIVQDLINQNIIKIRPKKIHLSLLLCGDTQMRKLNNEFRGKDKTTDVLSFPAVENLRVLKKNITDEIYLGDIAISQNMIKKQAKKFKISYKDEFIHLLMHGIIHLCGYDHEISDKEEVIMQKWEKKGIDLYQKKGLP